MEATVIDAFVLVAPDIEDELRNLSVDADVFATLDLDSMDHLNVMTELATRTGVEIPERDYPRLRSVRALAERLDAA
jgi:acyl carrier protein